MKLANAVRDKGEGAKEEMRVFVSGNRIEKPETEAIIQISSTAKPQETKSQDEPVVVTMEDNTTVAKKGKKAKKAKVPTTASSTEDNTSESKEVKITQLNVQNNLKSSNNKKRKSKKSSEEGSSTWWDYVPSRVKSWFS